MARQPFLTNKIGNYEKPNILLVPSSSKTTIPSNVSAIEPVGYYSEANNLNYYGNGMNPVQQNNYYYINPGPSSCTPYAFTQSPANISLVNTQDKCDPIYCQNSIPWNIQFACMQNPICSSSVYAPPTQTEQLYPFHDNSYFADAYYGNSFNVNVNPPQQTITCKAGYPYPSFDDKIYSDIEISQENISRHSNNNNIKYIDNAHNESILCQPHCYNTSNDNNIEIKLQVKNEEDKQKDSDEKLLKKDKTLKKDNISKLKRPTKSNTNLKRLWIRYRQKLKGKLKTEIKDSEHIKLNSRWKEVLRSEYNIFMKRFYHSASIQSKNKTLAPAGLPAVVNNKLKLKNMSSNVKPSENLKKRRVSSTTDTNTTSKKNCTDKNATVKENKKRKLLKSVNQATENTQLHRRDTTKDKDIDLRTVLNSKRTGNISNVPIRLNRLRQNTFEKENLVITVNQDINNSETKSETAMEPKSKKCKRIKLVINVTCNSGDESDNSSSDKSSSFNEDISFLDDFDIDDIVNSLSSDNSKDHNVKTKEIPRSPFKCGKNHTDKIPNQKTDNLVSNELKIEEDINLNQNISLKPQDLTNEFNDDKNLLNCNVNTDLHTDKNCKPALSIENSSPDRIVKAETINAINKDTKTEQIKETLNILPTNDIVLENDVILISDDENNSIHMNDTNKSNIKNDNQTTKDKMIGTEKSILEETVITESPNNITEMPVDTVKEQVELHNSRTNCDVYMEKTQCPESEDKNTFILHERDINTVPDEINPDIYPIETIKNDATEIQNQFDSNINTNVNKPNNSRDINTTNTNIKDDADKTNDSCVIQLLNNNNKGDAKDTNVSSEIKISNTMNINDDADKTIINETNQHTNIEDVKRTKCDINNKEVSNPIIKDGGKTPSDNSIHIHKSNLSKNILPKTTKPMQKIKEVAKVHQSSNNNKKHISDQKLLNNSNNSSRSTVIDKNTPYLHKLEVHISYLLSVKCNITSVIHEGSFSTIFKCISRRGEIYACKVLKKCLDYNIKGKIKSRMLMALQNSLPKHTLNTVYFVKSFSLPMSMAFIMEYYPKNLEQALKEHGKCFYVDLVQELTRQLVSAVAFLSNNDIVHTDIKPNHILLNQANSKLKLCGFDEANYDKYVKIPTSIESPSYKAPETLMGYRADCRSDVWSTAVVIHEMASGVKLFPGTYANEVLLQQMHTFGIIPYHMVTGAPFRHQHFNSKVVRKYKNDKQLGIENNKFNKMLYFAYNKTWRNEVSLYKFSKDKIKLRCLQKLLEQMLVLDPWTRLPISCVAINQFINNYFE